VFTSCQAEVVSGVRPHNCGEAAVCRGKCGPELMCQIELVVLAGLCYRLQRGLPTLLLAACVTGYSEGYQLFCWLPVLQGTAELPTVLLAACATGYSRVTNCSAGCLCHRVQQHGRQGYQLSCARLKHRRLPQSVAKWPLTL
jgi:hypothetical protein